VFFLSFCNLRLLASQDLVSCCDDCGAGCAGGDPSAAWDWWVSDGIVSEATYPYAFNTCEHHMNGTKVAISTIA
jgi:hypothetical protein